jgi:hypothetical protein
VSEQPDDRDFFRRAALAKAAGRERLRRALSGDVGGDPADDDQGDEGERQDPQEPAA